MARKCFLIIFCLCFLWSGFCASKVEARSESGNIIAALGTLAFLFVMGKYVFPYYGQNTVNARIRLGNRIYSWPNSRVSMQEICIEKVALPNGPPWDPWANIKWRCEEIVRIRRYEDLNWKFFRIGGRIYKFKKYKLENPPFRFCRKKKLKLRLGQFGTLFGYWECVE